jgi:hypothetical protein
MNKEQWMVDEESSYPTTNKRSSEHHGQRTISEEIGDGMDYMELLKL